MDLNDGMARAQLRPEPVRLVKWHRWSLYVSTLGLVASGLLWLLARHALRRHGEFGDSISPLEPWMLRVHGFFMLPALFLCGSLLKTHMIKAWQLRKNRLTGTVTAVLLLLLALTGYLLYYAGGEDLRPVLSVLHWVPGTLLALALPLHIAVGRGRRRAQRLERAA